MNDDGVPDRDVPDRDVPAELKSVSQLHESGGGASPPSFPPLAGLLGDCRPLPCTVTKGLPRPPLWNYKGLPRIPLQGYRGLPHPPLQNDKGSPTLLCRVTRDCPALPCAITRDCPALPLGITRECPALPLKITRGCPALPLKITRECPRPRRVPRRAGLQVHRVLGRDGRAHRRRSAAERARHVRLRRAVCAQARLLGAGQGAGALDPGLDL